MPLHIIEQSKVMALQLTADEISSLEEIKKKIDEFASHVSEDDVFFIRVDLSLNPSTPEVTIQTAYKDLLSKYRAHFDENDTELCEHLDISRSTLHNWIKRGTVISRKSLRRLASKAPTPELRIEAEEKLQNLAK